MTGCVLDSSCALGWILPDEASAAGESIDVVARQGAVVPAIWRLEVANALMKAARRGRIAPGDIDRALTSLQRFRIETDDRTSDRAWGRTLDLAREQGLTPYDASYLELAERRGIPVATWNAALAAAAGRLAIAVIA